MNKELATNTTVSHYRIVSKLGAGGMGEVYLAQDAQLDRQIALKILPAEFAADPDRMRRFVQEAKAAAVLNHPNIAHIYEIGESGGTNFIAMEYVDGLTLHETIHSEKSGLKVLLKHLFQVAEGLAKAHASGIVHRDLKPDNIMITREGLAKILDFGLAKLVETKPESEGELGESAATMMPDQHSTPGVVMGTAGYMSPEQAQGKPVDQRSDIFSFGCILYEAATGRKPFAGDSVVDTLHKIIYELAPAITDFNPSAPLELQRVIRKCLAKEPAKRYQTIRDTANDLEELLEGMKGVSGIERPVPPSTTRATGSTHNGGARSNTPETHPPASSPRPIISGVKQHKFAAAIVVLMLVVGSVGLGLYLRARNGEVVIDSIAVLPFQNKSSDADTEYLSDGLAESLIYRLSQLPNLKVSPTSSVFRYKGRETDPIKIGNELSVKAVMSGRIVQRGDTLTISVELVDVRNNKLLWGEQYERRMSDLLATQREIAAEIAQKLQLKLSGDERKGLTKRYTNNNEAYQLYLKGRFHFAKRTKDDILKGIDYFQQAIRLDPDFALAYARISDSYASMPAYPYLSPKEAFPQAKVAATRALEIDPTLGEAHTFLAYSLMVYDWNWAEAEREFRRAIELDPNSAAPHFRYGQICLAPMGRSDEAITEVKRALEMEPLDLNMGGNFSWVYLSARQYDRALEQGKKTYELDTNFVTARWNLSNAYLGKGMNEEAIAINEKSLQTDPTSQFALHSVGYAYAKSGRRREAEEVITRFKGIAKAKYVMSYWVASIYAALGDKDKAFAELEEAYAEHDWYLHRLKVDPFMDPLRDAPRFKEFVRRMGFPE